MNAYTPDGVLRSDFARAYGTRRCEGDFSHVSANLMKSGEGLWELRDDTVDVGFPITLFDKIKVFPSLLHGCKRLADGIGRVEVFPTKGGLLRQAFLQEALRIEYPLGTVTRKNLDLPPIRGLHRLTTSINVNLSGGCEELCIIEGLLKSHYKGEVGVRMHSNNCITVDSLMCGVVNELDFKEIAMGNKVIQQKDSFKTHKAVLALTNHRVMDMTLLTQAVTCPCCPPLPLKFRKRKPTTEEGLRPLNENVEVQVHDRCLNSSAVRGARLLPAVADFFVTMLETPGLYFDMAVVRGIGHLEREMGSLVPAHLHMAVQLACWKAGTRYMSADDQVKFSRKHLEPLLIGGSRYNFAESGGWTQQFIRGGNLLKLPDCASVSHKHRNRTTIQLFGERHKVSGKMTVPFKRRVFRNRGVQWHHAKGGVRFRTYFGKICKLEAPLPAKLTHPQAVYKNGLKTRGINHQCLI